ncbi:hypothetical protein Tco_1456979 [Tanacetum coccineum]
MTSNENYDSESDEEEPKFEKITINANYKIKTSLEEPLTNLDLKPLPDNLEYVFLEEPSFLPVIISFQLSAQNKSKLHKIQVLDDKKLVVQKQGRLNLDTQEVVKKEIMKLLDTDIIYPMVNSPWVSPIYRVPKKGSITVVTNENDELVPTRTVTGWRMDGDDLEELDLRWQIWRSRKKTYVTGSNAQTTGIYLRNWWTQDDYVGQGISYKGRWWENVLRRLIGFGGQEEITWIHCVTNIMALTCSRSLRQSRDLVTGSCSGGYFKLLDESQVVLRAPRKDGVYSLDLKNIVPSGGKSPSISFMRPFGCPLTILNTLDSLGKFDGKSNEGYLLGYSTSSKAFRVYNKRTKRVEENLHINFLEDQPNVAGTGPNWMFDLDFLTISMNYIPVSVENQVIVNAGTQDSYVAVKDVVQDAQEQPSENASLDKGIQVSEDVFYKEGQHQMPEDEQVWQDELEMMVTQEVIANAMNDESR